MPTEAQTTATIDDLYRVEGKAELIGGRIVHLRATGRRPNRVSVRILVSLDEHAERSGRGEAYADGMGFHVEELSSGRQSFSPDVSFCTFRNFVTADHRKRREIRGCRALMPSAGGLAGAQ